MRTWLSAQHPDQVIICVCLFPDARQSNRSSHRTETKRIKNASIRQTLYPNNKTSTEVSKVDNGWIKHNTDAWLEEGFSATETASGDAIELVRMKCERVEDSRNDSEPEAIEAGLARRIEDDTEDEGIAVEEEDEQEMTSLMMASPSPLASCANTRATPSIHVAGKTFFILTQITPYLSDSTLGPVFLQGHTLQTFRPLLITISTC